ncbi:peroxiredoxin-like family protein [Kangiella sp.]|uniref:peroxiredoxin-like family protein n=1 Tax=Kangiella sp. TaxID=1920245 RepID=UPI003A8ECB4F
MKPIKAVLILIISSMISVSAVALERTKIADNANHVTPLLIGQQVPDIHLWDTEGKPFRLLDKVKQQPTILLFYRGGWCPFCNAQLSQIQEIESELVEMGYQLLAISPDTPDELVQTSETRNLSYELISDFQLAATRGFGLAFHIEDDYAGKIEELGGKAAKADGDTKSVLPVPAVFILDKNGVIKFEYINPNYKVRIDPELLLAAAKIDL